MQQSTIFVEIISNRCYGRAVKSKKPKQKTCPLCRNRYCLAQSKIEVAVRERPIISPDKRAPDEGNRSDYREYLPSASLDRIATARQRAEALLQKVTA